MSNRIGKNKLSLSRRLLAAGIIFVAGTFLSGCMLWNWPGGVSASTTPLGTRSYTILGEVKEETCIYNVAGFAIGAQKTPKELIDEAAQSKGGDALINVTLRTRIFQWLVVIPVLHACSIVEGEAIKFTKG